MATKSTPAKKAADPKKAKSATKVPKAAKALKKGRGPNDRLPLVKVSVTYQVADGTTAEFTIESAKLRDKDFQLKLERFIAEASDSNIYVASDGLWKPNDEK